MTMRPAGWWSWCGALAIVAAAGCGGSSTSAADGGTDALAQDDAGGDAPGRSVIEIYVEGDPTAKTFTDGYSGQTPRDFFMGLQRFELLRSINDSAPVKVFDLAPGYVEVDMSTKSLVGVGRTPDIPAGTYTHGRVLLSMARFKVDATAHSGGTQFAGTMTVLDAISETTIDGTPFTKGRCELTFTAGSFTNTQDYTLPPLLGTAGGTIVDDGPRTWMVFPFPSSMVIDPTDTTTHQATVSYETYESFRWEEKQASGYLDGAWDVNANLVDTEVVKNFGATGYRVETL
jgi:hypothetical protein